MERNPAPACHRTAIEERAALRLISEVIEILSRHHDEPARRLAGAVRPDDRLPQSLSQPPQDARPRSGLREANRGAAAAGRHLLAALAAAQRGRHHRLSTFIASLAEGLNWTQTESYVSAPPYPGFLDHYAHAALLGPADLAPTLTTQAVDVRLGLLLLGPAHAYPPHAHPAEEIYLPLTQARWSRGEHGRAQLLPAGTIVHHAPQITHGIHTVEDPLIAIYLWLGDTRTPARFTGGR